MGTRTRTFKTVSFQFKVPKEEVSLACLKNPEQASTGGTE